MRKEGVVWKIFNALVIVMGLLLILGPVWVIFINSMKTMQEAGQDFFALPSRLNFDNYVELFTRSDFWSSLRNSVIVTVSSVALVVIFVPALAYAVARNMEKRYYKILYYYILAGIFIPFQVLMLPMVKQMTQMKMLNQTGLILLHLTFSLSTGLFLFVNYIRSLPTEIEEAARVDGCNVFQTYIRIVIHLIKPMVATIIVMDSLGCWNNFMIRRLSTCFQRTTQLDWEPQIFNAGTHARKLPNAVAYGPGCLNGLVPECEPLPEGHGGAHQPDEAQSIDALCLALKIYILAVLEIDELDLKENGQNYI